MLSVIIPTNDSEHILVPTLAALVPGATAGLVREVILADAGSRDATAEVADLTGCRTLISAAPLTERLLEAAKVARSPWLLFLDPGAVPQAGWIEEGSRFMEEAKFAGTADTAAAVFLAAAPALVRTSPLRQAIALVLQASGLSRPRDHGLLIGRDLYRRTVQRDPLHAHQADVIRELVRRLGRRRVTALRCGVVGA